MTVMQFIGGAVIIIGVLSIIVGWLIYLVQWIVCRKKKSCNNKKCIFRLYCINKSVRQKEQLQYRKQLLEEYMKNKKEEN